MKKIIAFAVLFILLLLIGSFTSANCQKKDSNATESLRSEYKKVSKDDVKLMLAQKGFFDKYWNKAGDFKNKFESKKINQDEVVIDHATGLMWHPSGSLKFMNLKEASDWIIELNAKNYAGYSDWRLPTLEEAASLLENSKQKNLYIDRAFDRRQWCIWTGDTLSTHLAWVVVFSGRIDWFDRNVRMNYVRPVRSLEQ
jgi:hypothetical protein